MKPVESKLPGAISRGAARKEQRVSAVFPVVTAQAEIAKPVNIRPVAIQAAPPGRATETAHTPPLQAGARLTAERAVQLGRDKGRVRSMAASPKTARASVARQEKSNHNQRVAASTHAQRKNPASPLSDPVTGRLRYTGAFSASPFTAPFQKSYNSRRSFGAS